MSDARPWVITRDAEKHEEECELIETSEDFLELARAALRKEGET